MIKKYIPYHDRKWAVDESDPIIQKRCWAQQMAFVITWVCTQIGGGDGDGEGDDEDEWSGSLGGNGIPSHHRILFRHTYKVYSYAFTRQ